MSARLALLASVDEEITESEALQLAVHHAVAELGGWGGAVHLRGPMTALRLVSSAGLTPALSRGWDIVDPDGPTAPARAVRLRRGVWMPTEPAGSWPGTAMATTPLFSRGRAVGALTVLLSDRREPAPEQWDFLRAVARWAERRRYEAPPPARPPRAEPGDSRLRDALSEVRVGAWEWNVRTGELVMDEATLALFGIEPTDGALLVENWLRTIHPDDLPWTLATLEKAIRNQGVYEVEYRARRPDGSYGWSQARAKILLDGGGEPLRLVGTAWDSTESRSARDALSRALRHMSDGFLAVDDEWRVVFANREAERTLGSAEQELVGTVLWDLHTVGHLPELETRCRQAAAASSPTGFDIRIPDTGRWYHLRLVPGPDGMTCYLTDVSEKRRRDAEQQAAGRAAAERATRITELTTALARATTSRDVVDAVAQRVLPPFGATGLIVQTIENDRLHSIGAVGHGTEFLKRLERQPISAGPPLSELPVFLSSPEEFTRRHPGLVDGPKPDGEAWAYLPLTVSGRTFGVCVISFDHPRRLTGEERTLLTAISGFVAQALARARLYDAEHTRARQLQRSLLPRELPALPACTTAARYLPAGQGAEVGGDWYDVIPLSAGRVALVIGDVMGHGLSEAATMGRLRTAVRTLADLELPPDEIMAHLNDIVGGLGEESYATCLCAQYDPTTRLCSITSAGHPPPAVVRPDGTVHFLGSAPNPPLGAADPPFETMELLLPEESLLVLYTDGLVESARRDIDTGIAALSRFLKNADTGDVERLCDELTAELLPPEHGATDDDAALLIARVHAFDAEQMASWELSEDLQAAGEAREHVREQLSAWDLDDLVMTTELLASELVGNVLRHAKGAPRLRMLRSSTLVCEVYDDSLTMPHIRRAAETDEGGRGLQLVAALSRRWGIRHTGNGKCIWTEQELPGSGGPSSDAGEWGLGVWEFDEYLESIRRTDGE